VFQIPGSQKYRGGRIDIPGDASSAAYLWAAAAVTGGKVRVDGITARWPQADLAILRVLADAGALVVRRGPSVTVEGGLSGPVEAELDGAPDLLPLIGAVAAVTPGRHRIRGAGHAALKESDRRKETVRLVRALGGRAEAGSRLLRIDGTARPRPIRVPDWRDHRMVMSAAVAALAASGPSTVGRASAVRKSFPGFWSAIRTLGVRWEEVR
jgi:3-phosphoshikimate 1-carboxyvinyltransferase